MGPFACKRCATLTAQAARCPVCGSRTFELSVASRQAAATALRGDQPPGRLVPITDAPSLRRRRQRAIEGPLRPHPTR